MALHKLSADDREIIRQCLIALRQGRFLDEDDIESRVGVSPEAYDAVVSAWPGVDDTDDGSDACLVINNALNEVCHGVNVRGAAWARWFTVPREAVWPAYRRWALARG